MRKLGTLWLLFFTGAVIMMAAGKFSDRRAPGFSLADISLTQHDPQDYRGKVLIVDVMTTSCPECQRLTKTLKEVEAKAGKNLGILSIVTMPDNANTVQRFIKDFNVDWPILFDCGQVIASYLKVSPSNPTIHFPHLFIIDKAGMIRSDHDGMEESALTAPSLSAEVDRYAK